MLCTTCKTEVDNNAKFCPWCGEKNPFMDLSESCQSHTSMSSPTKTLAEYYNDDVAKSIYTTIALNCEIILTFNSQLISLNNEINTLTSKLNDAKQSYMNISSQKNHGQSNSIQLYYQTQLDNIMNNIKKISNSIANCQEKKYKFTYQFLSQTNFVEWNLSRQESCLETLLDWQKDFLEDLNSADERFKNITPQYQLPDNLQFRMKLKGTLSNIYQPAVRYFSLFTNTRNTLENILKNQNDTSQKVKNACGGISIGMMVASLLLSPAVAVIGGTIGGYLMNEDRSSKLNSEYTKTIDEFIDNWESFLDQYKKAMLNLLEFMQIFHDDLKNRNGAIYIDAKASKIDFENICKNVFIQRELNFENYFEEKPFFTNKHTISKEMIEHVKIWLNNK